MTLTLKANVIPDLLAIQVATYGDRGFLKVPAPGGSGYRDVSFREFDQGVERIKQVLHAQGIGPRDRVAFLSPNRPEFAETAMGVWGLGSAVVSVSPRAADNVLDYMLENSGSNTIVVSAGPFLQKARELQARRPGLKILVLDLLPPDRLQEGEVSLAAAASIMTTLALPPAVVDPNDLALILYTSGTTKLPKGVPLTHRNLLFNREASRLAWEGKFTDQDTTLGWLPFFHVMGLPFEFLGDLYVGASYAFPRLRPGPPTPDQLLAALAETGANVLYSVPAMLGGLRKIAESDPAALAVLRGLKFVMVGGAPTDDHVGQWFADQGIRLVNGYGMTEVGGAIALGDPDRPTDWKMVYPLPGLERTLVPVEGIDEGGELAIRGDTVMAGYLGNEEATTAAFVEHGFRTGDVFTEAEGGGLVHAGRGDELFVHTTGEKTNPQPFELALQQHPEVIARVALVGHGRPHNVAIVQPNYAALKGKSWVEIEAAIWKVFAQENGEFPDYSRIRRENIIIMPPGAEPLPTAPKGSLLRPAVEARFRVEIEALYARKELERRVAAERAAIVERVLAATQGLKDVVKRVEHRDLTLAMIMERRRAQNVVVTGQDLNIAQLAAVSRDHAEAVLLDDAEIRGRVDASVQWLADALTNGHDAYGVTTGFGGSADTRTREVSALQHELIRFLHSTFGDLLPAYVVRGAMLIRANSNIKGYSGLRWQVLENVVTLLNKGITPLVPEQGSITASGDLSPLSHVMGVLIGMDEAKAEYQGRTISATEALKIAGLEPLRLGPKEGLAFVNGTSMAASLAGNLLYDVNITLLLVQACTALVVEMMIGTNQSYDPLVQEVKGHPGQIEAGANLLGLLAGSQLARDELDGKEKIDEGRSRQDVYSLRTAPQWIGPQIELILDAIERVTTELNSVSDNPLVDVAGNRTVHTGNFQGTSVAVSMETTRMALQHLGRILFAQLVQLLDKRSNNGLPQDLAGGSPSLDYGFKGPNINLGAYMAELSLLANSITNHVESTEHHNQDVNSLGLVTARYTQRALELLQKIIATHLYATVQAADLRHIEQAYRSATTKAIEAVVDEILPGLVQNAKDVAPLMKRHLLATAQQFMPFQFVYASEGGYKPLFRALAGELDDVLVGDPRAVGETPVVLQEGLGAAAALGAYRTFKDSLARKLDQALPEAREAALQQGAAHLLGNARSIYMFVRRDLGVGFMRANVAPSVGLETIYDAIRDGRIEKPLLDAFFPGTPS